MTKTPEIFYTLHMRLDGSIYAPELNQEQLTDWAVLVMDLTDGQFPGEFISLFHSEKDGSGKVHTWNLTVEIEELIKADEDLEEYDLSEHRIGCFEAGVGGFS